MTDTAMNMQRTAPGAAQRAIALWMLFAIGTLNFVDRQLLSVLVEPIRAEMAFSDTQFGLLTGLSFALFYALMGVPFAMAADRWHRVRLIAAACAIWSVFTAACGFAQTFVQLALARFGVGIGEAGGTAPSLSVLADYYPPERRPLVIGIFTANGPFGVFLGAAFGGWAAATIGWRNAFIAIGVVGALIAAPLLLMLVREPARGQMDAARPTGSDTALPMGASFALFLRRRSLRMLAIASGLSAFVSYGMLNWIPAFLMRTQGMPLSALATWFAPAAGITFGLGIWGGGALVNWAARRSAAAYALVPCVATVVLIPSFAAALLVDSWQWSLALMLVPMVACTIYVAPALALVQNLTPSRARATASAILLLMFNLVGLGCGPLVIGMISDALAPAYGVASLRFALLWVLPFAVVAAVAQYRMARDVRADLDGYERERQDDR
ncbi:spinster family MFS transporter [Sphingomonas dokdonensis]|uniref:Hexuronate transporter n=1 Tax=Sphingomonas dokdonensis TaxID=344880 RepID=A0A245ZMN9_9SPHN|nr:MFS transporter [Sphingomonas dokdonensis]OWK31002.1 hexuronate transporter [Sphingomonas dokdonensis]